MNRNTSVVKISLIFFLMSMLHGGVVAQMKTLLEEEYYTLLPLHSPVLQTKNPAALALARIYKHGNVQLGYAYTNGNFKPSLNGSNKRKYYLNADQFFVLNKSVFRGSFTYANEKEKGIHYSNMADPYRHLPYLFVDSVAAKDHAVRETYMLQSEWASRISDKISIGAAINYKAGLAAQAHDPRAQNTIARFNVKPGLMLKLNRIQLGGDMFYRYYNQEIDLITVKTNSVHTIYSLTGLGTFSTHTAATFSRLYKKHIWGGHLQLLAANNIFTGGASASIETVKDGRKESGATWSAIKSGSRLKGYTYHIGDVLTLQNEQRIHQIRLQGKIRQAIGTEILQTLEASEKNDTYNWLTYSEQDKYEYINYRAALSYQMVRLQSHNKMQYQWYFKTELNGIEENYYIPNSQLSFSNLITTVNYRRIFNMGHDKMELGASFLCNKNLTKEINLASDNVITQNIIYPDYQYNVSDFWGAGFGFCYFLQPASGKMPTYLKCDYSYRRSASGYFKGQGNSGINLGVGLVL
ncbi:hypothetical protein SAMN06265379_11045 [Saccharicrinis carchari]|uniref:DUF6850 domain-containing protein n=1 Tax=Saccharicrinis carchari TaxID=1168039 RepID=A0A521EPE0_SACCC|nr:DUF6850 family outer membrane beta-barrel protein [Saccharicrinis carchari]SMO85762.1 hypothetical protein SAMN06265379_11045 [Saccharicrinis carchari]